MPVTLPAPRIRLAALFQSWIGCAPTSYGSAVHSCYMVEDRESSKVQASTTSFPIGWRGTTAYFDIADFEAAQRLAQPSMGVKTSNPMSNLRSPRAESISQADKRFGHCRTTWATHVGWQLWGCRQFVFFCLKRTWRRGRDSNLLLFSGISKLLILQSNRFTRYNRN